MTNLTKELFNNLKDSLQTIIDIRETLIEDVKQLDLKDQKFIILLQKHAIALTTELDIKHINGMKTLMNTTDTHLPEFKLFEEITNFMHQASTLIHQKAPIVHEILSHQPQYKPIINKLLTGIEKLVTYTQITQKNISRLLNADRRLKTITNSPFKKTLGNLDTALLTLLKECGQAKTKLLTKAPQPSTSLPELLKNQYKKHIDSYKTDPHNEHLLQKHLPLLQQRHPGRHGNNH